MFSISKLQRIIFAGSIYFKSLPCLVGKLLYTLRLAAAARSDTLLHPFITSCIFILNMSNSCVLFFTHTMFLRVSYFTKNLTLSSNLVHAHAAIYVFEGRVHFNFTLKLGAIVTGHYRFGRLLLLIRPIFVISPLDFSRYGGRDDAECWWWFATALPGQLLVFRFSGHRGPCSQCVSGNLAVD